MVQTPTLDGALLSSSRAGADLGRTSDSRLLTTNVKGIYRKPQKGPGVLHWELQNSISTTEQ